MKILRRLLVVVVLLSVFAGGAAAWLSDKYVVPIMMYHKVEGASPDKADTVSPENFKKHMAYLKDYGYEVLTLDALVEGIKQNKVFPRKSVVVTFDDGYENNFTQAFPVLRQYQFPATIFVSPDFIAQEGFLDWQQLREMKNEGISCGSHGMTQAYLPGLPPEQQQREIQASRVILSKKLGVPVDYFAYPVGGFNDGIKETLKEAGYKGALATNRGHDRFNKDVFELNRIRFSDKDNSNFILLAKLSGYYNLFRKLKNPY